MKRKLLLVVAIILAIAMGVGVGYWIAFQRMMKEMDAASTPSPNKKVLYWYDPMYPQHRFDQPGKSPFMDMALVPKYADETTVENYVSINPRVVQNLGMRTAKVKRGQIGRQVEAVGNVAFNERDVAVVQARTHGYVEKLFVRAPLDLVQRGQALAEVLAPEWAAAQEEYLALSRSTVANEALKNAARQRLVLLGMSEEIIARVEREGKTQARVTLTAPVSGVVSELGARLGMTVMPGATLFRINGMASVWVNADVPEAHTAWVRPGGIVEARVPAYPEEVFKGRVSALLPEVSTTTRTVKTRVEIDNPRGRLKPGMFATINFAPAALREALLVPSEAVIQTGQRTVVILVHSGGKFAPVEVQIGIDSEGLTEIRAGLREDQEVIVSGQFLIDSEASLRAAINRLQGTNSDEPVSKGGEKQ